MLVIKNLHKVKNFIESNFRQRVLGNANPVKLGRCFDFLNDYYGFTQGGNHGNQYTLPKEKVFTLANLNSQKYQSELAESYGITKQIMNNYMRMASIIPELEDLVDTGIIIAECDEYLVPVISTANNLWANFVLYSVNGELVG